MKKLLMLLICMVCAAGCGKNGGSDETSSGGSKEESSIVLESSTLEPSLEAIVENMMPQDDMTSGACVFVTGDNEMIGVLTEPFDKTYYAIDARLREMVKEDLKAFNDSYEGGKALTNEGLGLLNGFAVLSLRFTDWNAYVEYMAMDIYEGTSVTVASLKKNDTLEGNFVSFEGEATQVETILTETKKQKYHIIEAKGDITIYLERPVAYVSKGAELVDEYTVKASEEVTIIMK